MPPAERRFGSPDSLDRKRQLPSSNQNRSVAVSHDRVFMGTADNHVVALDLKTGSELWRVNVEDVKQCGCNITGAPLVV